MSVPRLLIALIALLAVLALAGCGGEAADPAAERYGEQLKYLEPHSSLVVAIDLRYESRNWEHLRGLVSRGLQAYRSAADPAERLQIPPNADGAFNLLGTFAGLSFQKDVKPLLDGHLVIGITQPGERMIAVYRTESDQLPRVYDKLMGGEGGDAGDGAALVGDDTLVIADDDEQMRRALQRGRTGRGFPADRLAAAARAFQDPFIVAAGDVSLARAVVEAPNLRRALDEVPWLAAIEGMGAAVELDEDGADVVVRVDTDKSRLRSQDLPVGPPGELEMPESGAVAGASRNQSYTTTFASRTARALFADSAFARAVERAERELGARFEDEVLRQFDCPSVSVFEPASRRFGARSCVRDPDRMRELLPRLAPHLPRILTTMQKLGDEGLVGLLLIAPDAPLTPTFLKGLAAIVVKPLGGGSDDEQLYEVSGLRDDPRSELAQAGPERVVFGMIDDDFVVASDAEMARRARNLGTAEIDGEAASAVRVPMTALVPADAPEERAVAEVFGELNLAVSADTSGLVAAGRWDAEP